MSTTAATMAENTAPAATKLSTTDRVIKCKFECIPKIQNEVLVY